MSADTIFGMVVPCFAKIPLRWNTCSLPGPFLDMYKKGARPGRIEEESIDGMGTLCCAAMISSFLYPWCSSHTYQGWRVWIHRKERDQSVSKADQTWMGSRAKRTKPATPHRRLRSLNRKLCFHRVVLRRAGQTLRAHEPTRSCLINLLGSLNLPTK